MRTEQRLVILIPTYNEAENVEALLGGIRSLNITADVLFVDDNSPDGTGNIIDRLVAEHDNVHVIHRAGKLGIGSAHKEGIRWAYAHGFQRLLTMDCDFTHSPERIPEFCSYADQYDVVVGSRYLQRGSLASWSILRKALTRVGHFLTSTFLRMPFDATGAFRLYCLDRIPQGVFDLVYSQSYSFFFESLYVLGLNGFKIKEIPLDLPARTYGHSKMARKDVWHSLLLLIYLFAKTTLDRSALLYAPPFTTNLSFRGNDRDDATRRDWEVYWLAKSEPSTLIYDLIAVFYRKFIIKPVVNYFIPKYLPRQGHILHAGCGSGQVDSDVARKLSVCALDISPTALGIYRKLQPNVARLMHASIFDIPSPNDSFDGIYNLGVMEHFTEEEIQQILREFNRVLKPGANMVLFWPPSFGLTVRFLGAVHWVLHRTGNKDLKLHPDEITHVRSKKQIEGYLESAGFRMVRFYFGVRDLFTYVVIVAQKQVATAGEAVEPDVIRTSLRA